LVHPWAESTRNKHFSFDFVGKDYLPLTLQLTRTTWYSPQMTKMPEGESATTLIGSNQGNYFENAIACSKRTLNTTVATQLKA